MAAIRKLFSFRHALALGSAFALAALVVGLTSARPAHAAPLFTVSSTVDAHWNGTPGACIAVAPGSPCTLRAAIEVANTIPGSTVDVPKGVFTLALGSLPVTASMTIEGAGAADTIVDGADQFTVFQNTGFKVKIARLRIREGNAKPGVGLPGLLGEGGGVENQGNLLLSDDVLIDNSAAVAGGAVANAAVPPNGGFLFVQHSVIRTNHAGEAGGGIVGEPSTSTASPGQVHVFDGTSISDNSAGSNGFAGVGGGIAEAGNLLDVADSTIAANSAAAGGGMLIIQIGTSNTATISTSTIKNNLASAAGGGVLVVGPAHVSVSRSTLNGNVVEPEANFTAAVVGGGIANIGGLVTLVNDTLNANVAKGVNTPFGGLGGAIFQSGLGDELIDVAGTRVRNGALTLPKVKTAANTPAATSSPPDMALDLVTVAGNAAAAGAGGGVFTVDAAFVVHNTILANNDAANISTLNCAGIVTSSGWNLESANTCDLNKTGDLINTNPTLGSLASNGGPTETMALLAGSPAIDAADPACPGKGESTDQRGVSRSVDRCDIGAYEFQAPSPSPSVSPTLSPVPSPPVTGTGSAVGANSGLSFVGLLVGLGSLLAAGASLVLWRARGA